jgi:hypothetical protein
MRSKLKISQLQQLKYDDEKTVKAQEILNNPIENNKFSD